MLKQGIHPKVVQERLGHATISTTLDLYSHVTLDFRKLPLLALTRWYYPDVKERLLKRIISKLLA
jgi:integrase